MPIYEYTCESCGWEFEDFVPASDKADKTECLKCGKKTARKKMSAFSTCGCGSHDSGPGSRFT